MKDKKTIKADARKGEKGAALVMVLMIAFLLLVASAALLLEASMNTANVTDAHRRTASLLRGGKRYSIRPGCFARKYDGHRADSFAERNAECGRRRLGLAESAELD